MAGKDWGWSWHLPCRVQPAAPPRQSGRTAYNRVRTGIGRGKLRKAKEGLKEGIFSLPLFVNWTKAISHNKITNHKLALSFHAIPLGTKACSCSACSRLVSRLCLIPQDQGPPKTPRTLGNLCRFYPEKTRSKLHSTGFQGDRQVLQRGGLYPLQ